MEAYFEKFLNEGNTHLVKDVVAHLAETGVSKPSDLGFLSRASGEVSAGMVRLGCPQWWKAEHFDILRRAIEEQASNRHGVVALALLELGPPTRGRAASAEAPPVAVGANTPLPGVPASGEGTVSTGTPLAAVRSSNPPPGLVNGSADYRGSGSSNGGGSVSKETPAAAVEANTSLPVQSLGCSLAEIEEKEMYKTVTMAEELFIEFGVGTVRHRELQEIDGMRELMRQCIRTRCRNARGLRTRVRMAKRFLEYLRERAIDLSQVPDSVVAAWISCQTAVARSRGPLALYSVQWVEQVFAVDLHASCALVRAQVAPVGSITRVPRPVAARCPTEEQVCLWERVMDSRLVSSYVKCYVGAFCALTHGMLRWSDLQRSCGLRLTANAVTGIGPMKNQRYLTPWAAPRLGFTGSDWGAKWLDALQQCGLPGRDFVLLGSNKACSAFTVRPAEYHHAQMVMRFLLTFEPFRFSRSEAKSFSLHGFRHIYTTAMRQLDMPAEDIDDAGHWKRGSEMIRTYDASDCVKELQTKERVRQAVVAGWRRAESACLPPPAPQTPASAGLFAPCTPGLVGMPAPSTPGLPPLPSSTVHDDVPPPVLHVAAPPVVYVVDIKAQLMHKWAGVTRRAVPSSWTRCKRWRCGTPEANHPRALWSYLDPAHFTLCEKCFEA